MPLPAAGTLLALATVFAVTGPALLAGQEAAARSGDGARSCRSEAAELRRQVAGEGGAEEGEHELLGGLSAEQAGEPDENWFGSPPEAEAAMDKLEEARRLAAEGDVEGCRQLVEEVRRGLDEGGAG